MSQHSTGYSWDEGGIAIPDSGTIPSVVAAATLALPGKSRAFKVTGNTGITAITGLPVANPISLLFTGTPTVTNGATLKLAGAADFVATADDVLTVMTDGTTIWEVGRSVN